MAKQVQIRKGTAAQNLEFTGAEGELVYLTDIKNLVMHDGINSGGKIIPDIDMILRAIFPDYTKGVTMTSPFTAPTYGFAMWNLDAGASTVTINGNTIPVGGNDSGNEGPVFIMLRPDDVLTFSGSAGMSPTFYPCAGA